MQKLIEKLKARPKLFGFAKLSGFFLAAVAVCLVLLILASLLPQSAVQSHLASSIPQILKDDADPYLYEQKNSSTRDIWTESLILAESFTMKSDDLSSVFLNPRLTRVDDSYAKSLAALVLDGTEPDITYMRYWMGFRVTVRLLLCFFTFEQIRRIISGVFFALLALVAVSLAKNVRPAAGLAFAASMILVNPEIICCSMQFSVCFLIAFVGMLLAPYISRHQQYMTYYFMLLGIATMYFDFYTTPCNTFALPAAYLLLLGCGGEGKQRIGFVLRSAAAWFGSYFAMWVAKMALVNIFTDSDGFADAFGALFSRIFGSETSNIENVVPARAHNPLRALARAALAVCDDTAGAVLLFVFFAAVVIAWLVLFRRAKGTRAALAENLPYAAVFAVPIIWMVIAAQPTFIHYGYQYRTLASAFFAFFIYLLETLRSAERESGTDVLSRLRIL